MCVCVDTYINYTYIYICVYISTSTSIPISIPIPIYIYAPVPRHLPRSLFAPQHSDHPRHGANHNFYSPRATLFFIITPARVKPNLAFTRYCFTSRLLCTIQSSVCCPLPPVLPALLQYYCTPIAQYTPPPPTPLLYAIHHTILAMAISCKGQNPIQVGGATQIGLIRTQKPRSERISCKGHVSCQEALNTY